MKKEITSILKVVTLAERLKFELRHSFTSNGRQESVAEHHLHKEDDSQED